MRRSDFGLTEAAGQRACAATVTMANNTNFFDQWSVISEVFAIMGLGQTNPRFQSGIRYSPTKNIDWDSSTGEAELSPPENAPRQLPQSLRRRRCERGWRLDRGELRG
jgi:hypothetical protein